MQQKQVPVLAVAVTIIASMTSMTSMQGGCAIAANQTTGKATVYSDHFAGKKTASGERYKPGELTAASNQLPIGSKVIVKNRKTGKKVTVRINDRMAKNAKAHLDLSKGAAKKLGVKGTAPVEAKVVAQ